MKACACRVIGAFDHRTGVCDTCEGNVVLRLHPDIYVRADELHAVMGPHEHGPGMAPCLALSMDLPARSDIGREAPAPPPSAEQAAALDRTRQRQDSSAHEFEGDR